MMKMQVDPISMLRKLIPRQEKTMTFPLIKLEEMNTSNNSPSKCDNQEKEIPPSNEDNGDSTNTKERKICAGHRQLPTNI